MRTETQYICVCSVRDTSSATEDMQVGIDLNKKGVCNMAVIRVNKTADFTIMGNSHLKEKEMSLKAKGLLSMMLSLPNDWDYSVAGLVSICKESDSSIKSALDELKKFGYLVITKKMPNQTESGKIEYEYNIFEYPQGKEPQRIQVDIEAVEEKPKPKNNDADINSVVERYNRICVSLPKVIAITDKRKELIKARLKQYSMVEIEEVFLLAERNDFLKRGNGKWTGATFDWLMNVNNFVKVLEGNYENRSSPQPQKQTGYDSFMSGLQKFVEENQ